MAIRKMLLALFVSLTLCINVKAQPLSQLKANLTAAQQANDTISIARAWYKLGVYFDTKQEQQKSSKAFYKALFWAKSINSCKAISSIANYLASNYSEIGETDSSIYYYKVALNAGITCGDSSRIPKILLNLRSEYLNIGDYVKAVNNCISAIQIKEQLKDSTNLAYFYQQLGEVYKTAGEKDKWEEYIKKGYALIHNENYANTLAVAAIYNDLGGIAEGKGYLNEALLYYDTLRQIGVSNNYDNAIGVSLSNRAAIYKRQGEIKKALAAAIEANKYENNEVYQQIYDYNLLAELYLANGNTGEALRFATLALNNSAIDNYADEKMRTLKTLYQIEKKRGNYRKALFWHEDYDLLADSINNREIRTQILDLELKYETEKKEQQIKLLITENKLNTQRINAAIGIVAVLLIVILLIIYILGIRKKQAALVQNDLQQQVLRAQMNPHFIFNVLGSIQNFMMQNDNRKASKFLSQFASLTRATLNNSVAETISLASEISMLTNYIELEKMRSPNKFDFSINFDEGLEVDFIQIPPMLVQPFVENSIKHGFINLDRAGFLSLHISDKTDCIEFIIEDNGNGIQQKNKTAKKHQSMALKIFEKRRKLIQQKHKKDFKFEILNLKDTNPKLSGVKITINIPVLNND